MNVVSALLLPVPHAAQDPARGPRAEAPERDPTLVTAAYKKQRLFLFTRREPADAEDAAVST